MRKLSKFLRKFFFKKTTRKSKLFKNGTQKEFIHVISRSWLSRYALRIFFSVCLLTFVLSMTGGALFYWYIVKDLPSPKELSTRVLPASTKILDRNGVLLYTIYKDKNRTPIPLSEIPLQMKLATLAIEDADFYEHPGFSLRGIVRSIKKNIESGQITGGSTITQQLVKNALLSPEKTFIRKAKEVTLAVLVERTYSKNQILEMYLNEVPFGGTSYGVQEAAKIYFGKDIKDVSLAEAALLSGLPRSPTRYSPFGHNPESAIARQKEVLRLMEQNGFITKEQRENAEAAPLHFTEHRTDIKAPHFVEYVRGILEEKYGVDVVAQGGLSVTTTLDYEIQKLAEKTVREEVENLKKLHVENGAAVVLNPQNGEILAMVGSRDYFDSEHDGNVNVTLRPRQPGSSIKVVNYAYALSHGFTPASIVEDSPITFLTDGQPPYSPKNYENEFRGKITLRSALAESRNIPAVRLLYTNGLQSMIDQGTQMGITTWLNKDNYGLSLTLGGGEVRLLDLARVYATIANYGKRPPLVPILRVVNYKHELIDHEVCDESHEATQIAANTSDLALSPTPTTDVSQTASFFDRQVLAANTELSSSGSSTTCRFASVLDPRAAFQITDILKDNIARAPTFGLNSLLVVPKHPEVAVKTGTSNDLRDNLAVGYTKDYLVAVWVGNNDNTPMARIASGVTGATPIWNKILSPLLAEKPTYEWSVPPGLQKLSVCGRREEWFWVENIPSKFCLEEQERKMLNARVQGKPVTSITPTPEWKREIVDLRRVRKIDKNQR
jgi:membrane carboxypeptidase/penicillin-binding protein